MDGVCITVTPKSDNVTYIDFVEKIDAEGISDQFSIQEVMCPVYYFREEFLEHVATHGFSSMFDFSIVMEDVISKSMPVDDIERVVETFLSKLQGAKKLIIIDPYFFAKSSKTDVVSLFSRLLKKVSDNLEEICFVTNGRNNESKENMISVIDHIIKVVQIETDDFHDRCWVDPDTKKGILMGTSLNGLGKKICLIDSLKEEDVTEIVELVNQIRS